MAHIKMKHRRLPITILIFVYLINFTYGQTDDKSSRLGKKDKIEKYKTPILGKLMTSCDHTPVMISIGKILTCTETENEVIYFVRNDDKYKGYCQDTKGKYYRLDSINIQTIQEMIDLEKKCLDTDWDCYGQVTSYVEINIGNEKSKFKYCNKEIKGFDLIIENLIHEN